MISIANKRNFKGPGVYIGRPSVLGNPFAIGRDGSREEVIRKYQEWLREEWKKEGAVHKELLKLAHEYKSRGSLTLVCWCAPLPCHGDFIKHAIETLVAKM